MWVDFEEAQRLIRSRQVTCIRHNGKIRALRAFNTADRSKPEKPTPLRRRSIGDSHKNERRDNPAGVWTIDRIGKSTRTIFLAVISDCSSSSPYHAPPLLRDAA